MSSAFFAIDTGRSRKRALLSLQPDVTIKSNASHLTTSVVPTLAAVLMPKCPLCLIAIAGALGVELPIVGVWLTVASLVALAAALIAIARVAWRQQRLVALTLAVISAGVIAMTRFTSVSPWILHLGVASLIATALWSAWPRASGHCHDL